MHARPVDGNVNTNIVHLRTIDRTRNMRAYDVTDFPNLILKVYNNGVGFKSCTYNLTKTSKNQFSKMSIFRPPKHCWSRTKGMKRFLFLVENSVL